MIQHCVTILSRQGGVQTYVNSLLRNQTSSTNSSTINLLEGIDQSQFGLLHLHDPKQLQALSGQCPAVFTLHNHSTYCPSGTKYLPSRQACCERSMSYLGCTWGRLVEGCGSRRPERIAKDFKNSYEELSLLKRHKTPIIAISNYSRRQLIQQGIDPSQVVTIHHGIENPSFSSQPLTQAVHKQGRLLFVGRIVPQKGLDLLFAALSKVPSNVHLDIAGEGWFEPQLRVLAHQLKIEDRITWHGWCSPENLDKLYKECFAVAFPSRWPEPAGLITLEAYARLRPVIATNVGGIPEYILPNKTGLLVSGSSSSSLAEAITRLSGDLGKSAELAEQGYEYFQNRFTITAHIEKLNRFYEEVSCTFKPRDASVSFTAG